MTGVVDQVDSVTGAGEVSSPPSVETVTARMPLALPRPGSRLDRMSHPLAVQVLGDLADREKACRRPQAMKKFDYATRQFLGWSIVPCNARLASKCKACAEKNRKRRQKQIEEGWHLTEEPTVIVQKPTVEVVAVMGLRAEYQLLREEALRDARPDHVEELDAAIEEVDEWLAGQRLRGKLEKPSKPRKPREVRSTRRRTDVAKLPRRKVEDRSLGRVYVGRDGREHRPSTFVTPTLPSFGAVHSGNRSRKNKLIPCACGSFHGENDPLLGTPRDPDSYDYRAHAIALITFPRVLDRFWQNLRRAVGWKVAYAGVVEMQRRLATHAHFAVRGTFPRALVNQVAQATYYQAWWPHFDQPRYTVDQPPVWDEKRGLYADPTTGRALMLWEDADPTTGRALMLWEDAVRTAKKDHTEPAALAQLGTIDCRGMEGGTAEAKKTIRYATKYVTKDLVDQTLIKSGPQQTHFQRLHHELSTLPCSERCANWLLYGVEPKLPASGKPKPNLIPGACKGPVHQSATLGYTGRRVLITRNWTSKTLTDLRDDGQEWFRAMEAKVLDRDQHQGEGHDQGDGDGGQLDGEHQDQANADGNRQGQGQGGPTSVEPPRRYYYQRAEYDDPDVPSMQARIFQSIAARARSRRIVQEAREIEREERDQGRQLSATGLTTAGAA